ncbi:hypothetical protein [Streptomyces sp. TRM49041]|uniref:hypothetical protein n=1 Tax=Streptomyces sp. TRM49041 TaxID=2603216 RepID=UPI00292A3D55|nr:hypothetical protein [Streptomyces sp. TRM49041]
MVALLVTALTPVVWLLDSPDTGQFVGASIQAGTGVAAVVWALLQPSGGPPAGPDDTVVDTGEAESTDGGAARTGIRRRGAADGAGSARAERTGDAAAHGPGSAASTGIEYD